MQRALLLLLIALSYALYAGAPAWTLVPLWIVAAAAALSAPRHTFSFPADTRRLDVALVAILVVIALQLLPLPRAVAGMISPHATEVVEVLQFQIERGSAWTTLSVNRAATQESLAIAALAILTFWISRGVFSFGASTREFCRILAIIGAAGALSAIVFRATAPGLVHGALLPAVKSANPFGAFVNRNHFAGWLLLIAAPVGGYLIAHLRIHPDYREGVRRAFKRLLVSGALLTAAAGASVVVVLLLTLSRSGAVGLGSAALFGWSIGRRRLRIERSALPGVLAMIGIALFLAALFVDIAGWATRVEESLTMSGDRSRLTIWRESLPIVRDFWLSGTGAGTYSDAMIKYQESRVWIGSMGRWAHFNTAHSHYLQAMAEGGVLLLVPLIAALAAVVKLGARAISSDRGEMHWVRIGAAAGLLGIAVQSVWETSLVMPANAVLCGAVAGLLLYHRSRDGAAANV